MKLVAHRGVWTHPKEKNSMNSFEKAFVSGFGVETDFRDCNGKLVISHDVPEPNFVGMSADEFFHKFRDLAADKPLAINVKADGIALHLKQLIEDYDITEYRCFDMSVPDARVYISAGLKILSRLSEVERESIFEVDSYGIWLDCFFDDWYDTELIESYLKREKEVWIVSPELHGRCHLALWQKLKNVRDINSKGLYLCTDFPAEAKEFFYEQD